MEWRSVFIEQAIGSTNRIVRLLVLVLLFGCNSAASFKGDRFKILSVEGDIHDIATVRRELITEPYQDKFSVGYTPGMEHWVEMPVSKPDSSDYFLQLTQANINWVDFYLLRDTLLIDQVHTGIYKPFEHRDVRDTRFTFQIDKEQVGELTVLLRLKHRDGGLASDFLWFRDTHSFTTFIRNRDFLLLSMTGVQIFAVLSAFLYGLIFRSRDFIVYGLYSIFVVLIQMMVTGYLFEFVLPGQPSLYSIIRLAGLTMGLIMMKWLAIRLLRYKHNFKPWRLKLSYCIIVILSLMTAQIFLTTGIDPIVQVSLTYRKYSLYFGNFMLSGTLIFLFISAVQLALRRDTIAILFTLSTGLVILTALSTMILRNLLSKGEIDNLAPLTFFMLMEILSMGAIIIYKHILESKERLRLALKAQEKIHAASLIDTQEQEKMKIAQDLHDGIGQQLAVIKMGVSELKHLAVKDPAVTRVAQLSQMIDRTVQDTRNLSHQMMPAILSRMGLTMAIKDNLEKAFEWSDISYQYDFFNVQERYREDIEIALYRILQELIVNIFKHASATKVDIQCYQYKDVLRLVVEDNGRGFDVNNTLHGNGINNIRTRLMAVNGTLYYELSPEGGTLASISIPVDEPELN